MVEVEIVGEVPAGTSSRARRGEPVTLGVPVPAGALTGVDRLELVSEGGAVTPVQARCLERRADGSVRWVLLDFLADIAEGADRWRLRAGGDTTPRFGPAVSAVLRNGTVVVDTGPMRFVLGDESTFPFREVLRGGSPVIDPAGGALRVVGEDGRPWRLRGVRAEIEDAGPIRAAVLIRAGLEAGRARRAQLELRLHFFAGLGTVRAELMVRNPRRALHPNGYWDLGDPGSIRFRELSLALATPAEGPVQASLESGQPVEDMAGSVRVRQDSSGGMNWQSETHVAADGRVHLGRRGYHGASGRGEITGLRATPAVVVGPKDRSLGLAVPRFWQNFPVAIDAGARSISLSLFPDGEGPAHELQGGEQKTHVFHVAFGPDDVTEGPLEWCRAPLRVRCETGSYARAGVGIQVDGTGHVRAGDYERLIAPALDGPSSFFEKREAIDEYGWRHFGDLFGDHETAGDQGGGIISHYNNQYDAVQAFATHFMRTGDWRWWELADDLARHVVDIDIYHAPDDRAAYAGGLFWHTNHYTSAATATHRSYSRVSGLPGGGPSNEHNYTTGLLTHYLMTGSRASADAAVELARWVVAMDDGARSRFRFLDRGDTGLASSTYSPDYHGPGRGAGNSINALVDGHRLTGDETLLAKAESLIRRCVHPDDDPVSFELLDAERRWSYTVFLQMLGKFLDYKRELGREDAMYAYAREVLVRYARWMATDERPALDFPERLEYPTETWAAQDVRKADVFHLASRYAPAEDRERFLERRDWFFAYALDTLASMPTAAFTRPLVLLLGQGARVAYSRPEPVPAGGAPHRFAPRVPFVPQKHRAIVRLRRLALTGLTVTVAGALIAAWLLFSGRMG